MENFGVCSSSVLSDVYFSIFYKSLIKLHLNQFIPCQCVTCHQRAVADRALNGLDLRSMVSEWLDAWFKDSNVCYDFDH